MKKIKIEFPNGDIKEFDKGINAIEIAKSISEGLAREVIAVKINDKLKDAFLPIEEDAKINLIKFEDPEGLDIFRHSSAHLLAQAVLRLFPEAKPTIGPAVDEGFYYDFDIDHKFTPEDLEKIEQEMKNIVKENFNVKRIDSSKKELIEEFKHNEYKIEMINNLEEEPSMYQQGEFKDLCSGPHIPRTGMVKALKLTKIAGAYWRADAKNKQLQRLYGISFPDKKMLKEYLDKIEEAKKRDHRKIGQELDFFTFHEEGPGFPLWHEKGMRIYNIVVDSVTKILRRENYNEIKTPIILHRSLWEKSGHWKNYKENMYFTKIDERDFAVKPMNCPGALLAYKSKPKSYKDLPLRIGEFGLVHRHELAGVLHGLFRVRSFTQDDAHVFCTEEQLDNEIIALIDFVFEVYNLFGFNDVKVELSTRPEKFIGDIKNWDKAEDALKRSLEKRKIDYALNEGDGAFYGPKIDFHIRDCMNRSWQCGTIQVDFAMPVNLDINYMGQDGTTDHRPIMIHRAILGSVERFIGILIEHYGGKFPLWLSPLQVKILTVSDKFNDYANQIANEMKENGLFVETDLRSESIPKKVREAQLSQANYILVVGEKELNDKTVAVRNRNNEIEGTFDYKEFIQRLLKEVKNKK
ncbi:MAG: threonine--tRNA ligase [Candidatus Woesearchaeota archaeon]